MVVKEYEYIKGATVSNPKRRSSEKDKRKYEELERSKKERNRRLKENTKRKRKTAMQIATLIFIFGLIIVARDSKVYDSQKEVSDLQTQINSVKDDNEALKVDLLKVASLENIRTNAEQKLGMIMPSKDNVVHIEIPKSAYDEVTSEDSKADDGTTFSKLMDALS